MSFVEGVRPVWAEVDLAALVHNYRELVRRIGPDVDVIASIKANAYGHGAVAVARTLSAEGVFALATGSFDDAVAIREAGVPTRILLFGGALPDALRELLRHDLIPTVYSVEAAEALSRAARRPTPVYVKVDGGLGRLGVPVEEAEAFVRAVAALPHIVVEGLYTHLPFVDPEGMVWAAGRLPAFRAVAEALARSGLPIPVTQAVGSAGVLAGLEGGFSAVCPGHVLYGLPPAAPEVMDCAAFRPVMRALKTRLIHVAHHGQERRAGIGGRLRVRPGSVTGVVPLGRYDGYRTAPAADAAMLVRGRRAPVLGLSLEHVTLDLSEVDGPAVGDEVVALGEQDAGRITLEELAAWEGSSVVDLLMTLERRVPYRYLGAEPAADADAAALSALRA